MRAGSIDRQIAIVRKVQQGRNSLNEQMFEAKTIAVVWGSIRYERGFERFAAQQLGGAAVVTFILRWRDSVEMTDVLLVEDVTYEIVAPPREIGRRVGFEIDCRARADVDGQE